MSVSSQAEFNTEKDSIANFRTENPSSEKASGCIDIDYHWWHLAKLQAKKSSTWEFRRSSVMCSSSRWQMQCSENCSWKAELKLEITLWLWPQSWPFCLFSGDVREFQVSPLSDMVHDLASWFKEVISVLSNDSRDCRASTSNLVFYFIQIELG